MALALVDWIRTANRRRIERRRLAKPLVDTPLGFRFSGLSQMLGMEWEAEERALIQSLFGQVDLFVNVGAHYGFYACLAQKAGLKTIAVEPVAANCLMIAKHIRANGWGDNISLLPVACGDRGGFIDIRGGGSGGTAVADLSMAPAGQVQTVPVVRLDDVVALQGRRALVLMDVEGFELQALRGAEALLAADPAPVWIVEVLSHFGTAEVPRVNHAFLDTFRFMHAAGYRAYLAAAELLPFDLEAAANAALQPPDQVTNFVFLKSGVDPGSLGMRVRRS